MAWRIQHIGQVLSLAYLPHDHALPRPRAGAALAPLRRRRGARGGPDRARPRSGRPAPVYLLAGFVALAPPSAPSSPCRDARACLLPLAAAALVGLAVIAVPVMLSALLTAESNRAAIDYIGAGRGSLHPALLLTAVVPELFGASGRMEDYWGPPSFAWNSGHLPRAEHGPGLHRRHPAAAADPGGAARPAVGARGALLHGRRRRAAALCPRLVHAGLPHLLRGRCPASACSAGRPTPPS